MNAEAALRPVASAERIELVDILRGFALLGVLLVNFWGAPGPHYPRIDGAVGWGLELLADNSFWPLFSFLFGLGFAIQLQRAREFGAPVVGIYVRRMLALLLIGTASVLVGVNLVLLRYALVGLLLIPLHRLPLPAVLAAILMLFAFQAGEGPLRTAMARTRDTPAATLRIVQLREGLVAELQDRSAAVARRARASAATFGEFVDRRWDIYAGDIVLHANSLFVLRNDHLLMFLIGLYVGRKGWLQHASVHRRAFGVAAAAAAVLAIGGTTYDYTMDGGSAILRNVAVRLSNYGVTAFYIAAIAFLVSACQRPRAVLRVLAPAGRMGLSNYLVQWLVMLWLVQPYPYGSKPSFSTTAFVLINLAFFFVIQVPLSHWWMRWFRFGPAEWLWHSLTYTRLQPIRRPVES